MYKALCQVRFCGGPFDGAFVTIDGLSCPRTISLPTHPVGPQSIRKAFRVIPESNRSVYRLAGTTLGETSREGDPAHYEYVFAGFASSGTARPLNATKARIGPLAPAAAAIGRFREKAVRWMLAPVEHPLQLAK